MKKNTIWILASIFIVLIALIFILTKTNIFNKSNEVQSGSSLQLKPTFYDTNGNILTGSSAPRLLKSLAVISYNNQCSLPSCPSGYSATGTTCDNSTYTCTQTCTKTTAAYCSGSYGSSTLYSGSDDAQGHGVTFFINFPWQPLSISLTTSKCYEFYSHYYTEYSVTGTATSNTQQSTEWYSKLLLDGGTISQNTGTNYFYGSNGAFTVTGNTPTYSFGRGDGGSHTIQLTLGSSGGSSMTVDDVYGNPGTIYEASSSWIPASSSSTTTQCSYTPPAVSMNMKISVQNTGSIPYDNVHIVNATPTFFSNALPTSSVSLPIGNTITFQSNNFTVQTGTNQTFDIWISGLNTYTNKTDYVEGKATYSF